jgi:hypothetical protein
MITEEQLKDAQGVVNAIVQASHPAAGMTPLQVNDFLIAKAYLAALQEEQARQRIENTGP